VIQPGPASSGAPVPLSLSTSLSASRDFSDVDAYFARLVGTVILALTWPGYLWAAGIGSSTGPLPRLADNGRK